VVGLWGCVVVLYVFFSERKPVANFCRTFFFAEICTKMYNLTKKREIFIIFDENIPIFHVKKEQII
jgi:hypothetical protein